MKEYKINLNTIDKVKQFASIAGTLDCDIRLVSEPYAVDGKSILGIFSLDLNKKIAMQLTGTEDEIEKALDALRGFMD